MSKNDNRNRRPVGSRTRRIPNAARSKHLNLETLEERLLLSANPIVTENLLPGSPASQWQVAGSGDPSIQGFSTDISVDQGQTVDFKVNDPSGAAYHLDIYRMGYYQGNGARLVKTIPSSETLKQNQPAPLTDYDTGLVDAGNWSVSASWNVPSDATSGIYFANVTRDDTGGASQIFFVVRDDSSTSDLLYQTSDSTWEAYNSWDGTDSETGKSLYVYDGDNPDLQWRGHAVAVSYNRPLTVADTPGGLGDYNSPLHAEYPMVRWLESNGYDVSYTTDLDTAIRGDLILNHNVFMSVGHDEYWSEEQRDNVEAARDAGINLAFFSGNEAYWKTRWAPSISSSASPDRTVISYKESQVNEAVDPLDQAPTYVSTPTWRDLRFGAPADAGRPENALTGTLYMNDRTNVDLGISLNVPASDSDLRFWRNTSVADLQPGQVATLGQYIVGYETDEDLDNGFRPAGLIDMSSTSFTTTSHVNVPWGSTVGPGSSTHSITLYKAPSGALVFGAGTVQWSWGLDGNHNNTPTTPDSAIQQATVNLLADMHAQPATLQPGLVAATASTDVTAPTSVITGPASGSSSKVGSTITITGTATDAGGGVVGGVEVSTDGGQTWHPATGRSNWSYTWVVDRPGPIVIMSRASDDSANVETPSQGLTISGVYQPTSTTGLVASYSFDEGSGTTVHDLSGLGNSGMTSNTTWAPGLFGQALSFNGTNSWVTINDSNSLDLTNGMTLEAWVKPAGTNDGAILVKEQSDGLSYSLYAADGDGEPSATYVHVGSSEQLAEGDSSLPVNTWSFLTATYDGSDLLLYVNGSLVSDQNVTGPILTSTGALRIGGNSVWGDYFQGLIDQIRIYNRPLNAGEILSDMSAQLGGSQETTPPTGALTGPTSGATVTGVTNVTATASDNVMVAGVQFLLNGANLGNRVTSAPYTLSWDTRSIPNGTYTISAIVSDVAGNVTRLGNRTITISNAPDTTPPAITLRNPPAGLISGTVIPTAVASDSIGIAGVQFKLNGVNIGALDTTAPYQIAWDTTTVPDGTYTFTAVAHDLAGNLTTSTPISITVDNTRPTSTALSPASGSTGVSTSTPAISVTFDEQVQPGFAQFLVKSSDGFVTSGQVIYNAVNRILGFVPDGALEPSTTYTVTVTGALDLAGNPMSPVSWTFTTTSSVMNATLWGTSKTPAVTSVDDPSANELGVKFTSDIAGYVTGIRFYKGVLNTGTHVGHLWDASGQLLASVTFTGETSSGWQQATFSQPVAISAGATYVASYYAPSGGYAADSGYFASSGTDTGVLHAPSLTTSGGNGVYWPGSSGFPSETYNATNYWVDVVFSNVLVPTVSATTPTADSSGVAGGAPGISASFSKPVQPDSIVFTLRDAAGNLVPATLSYDPTTGIATLTPLAPLTPMTTYQATVSGALDLGGIAMASPYTWSFTTAPIDTTAPTVLSRTPSSGADNISNAAPALSVLAVFSEAVQSGTISFVLTDPSGNVVPTTVTYDTASHTVALIPNQALSFATTYTATLGGALDLNGNAMASMSWSFTTGQITNATLFNATATPAVISSDDPTALELGMTFSSDVGGYVTGVRFYKGPLNIGTHVAHIWAANDTLQFGPCPGCGCGAVCFLKLTGGSLLASATFTDESASGWQDVTFSKPVFIMPNTKYIVSYSDPNGGFSYDEEYFTNSGADAGVLHAPSSSLTAGNGVFGSLNSFPTSSYNGRNYWVDVDFSNNLEDHTPPTIVSTTPASSDTGVASTATVSATFSEAVDPNTVTYSLKDSAGHSVAVSAAFSQADNTLVLTPLDALSPLTKYTVTIGGATDLSGNSMATPMTWSFTTDHGETNTIWSDDATPTVLTVDDSASVVLGVKFTSDFSGSVTGVRFYKGPGNTGTHVGRLWNASGQLLATATFTDETDSGWQEVNFATSVPIVADATYVVSYDAPNGHYSSTSAYFAASGADSGPLHALPTDSSGGNGVYVYGSNLFPTESYNATNYWVDVVFSKNADDDTPPTIVSTSPASSDTGVVATTTVSATFSEAVDPNSVTYSLVDSGGQSVAVSAAFTQAGYGLVLTPLVALSPSTEYTVTISGATDLNGNSMAAPMVWSFTTKDATLWSDEATPEVLTSNDTASVVLGVKFTSDVSGSVLGVRFYKGSGNTGTHVGRLWSESGELLATATFTDETASGWQEVNFATPVAIVANAIYVVSYDAPVGGYSYTSAYFADTGTDSGPLHALPSGSSGGNGLYIYGSNLFPTDSFNATNYWVDVVFRQDESQSSMMTTMAAPANPSSFSQSVSFNAMASASSDSPTGTVTSEDTSTTSRSSMPSTIQAVFDAALDQFGGIGTEAFLGLNSSNDDQLPTVFRRNRPKIV